MKDFRRPCRKTLSECILLSGRGSEELKLFRWFTAVFLFFAFFLIIPKAYASDQIRVLLDNNKNYFEFAVVQGNYQLIDGSSGLSLAEIKPWELWTVTWEGLNLKLQKKGENNFYKPIGSVILRSGQENDLNLFRINGIRYRGDLIFQSAATGIMVVNCLSMEHYLYGVLPKELSPNLAEEALKAQAVSCRTLATYRKGSSVYYDVTAGTGDQVYGGYDAEENPNQNRVKEAVDSTAGEVLVYDDGVINAVFHSNAGGQTASSQEIWGGARPYLQPVISPFDSYALEYLGNPNSWPGNTYQWSAHFSLTELQTIINNWNRNRPGEQIKVGNIQSLRLIKNGQNHELQRVAEVEIIGSGGKVKISGEKARQLFQLKSTLFDLDSESVFYLIAGYSQVVQHNSPVQMAVIAAKGKTSFLDETAKSVLTSGGLEEMELSKDGFTFIGKGNGHGVGMSQWGAVGMAEAGYNYQQILEYYYNQNNNDGRLKIVRL